ncbi:type III restriction protein res subunit [[Leptolyngbya] sp. PCC 7376]|uniref:DEAD/DEAH box helicase n=1 Tax=[Leptolyngbya] sp. PCC 7376 TaxID=111781 RepID=UPI00029F0A71|nr:DEAD/DEAH box helicase family protein [[Leptolyngbya] sp. PCC 7376]AFY39721.1 type III restriction protein res subunit [[Leptolyngbya] sp. PCC 7376]
MPRLPKLEYDRGTLTLHPPPRGKDWLDFATWDDRIEKFRIPAYHYRSLVKTLNQAPTEFIDASQTFTPLDLQASFSLTPYLHQTEALTAWKQGNRQGVVVLPTAAGKTYLAQLAIESTPRSTLILVPTLDLMHQWYEQLTKAFPGAEVGLLGGGSRDRTPILVATYHSAAIHAETLGNQYALQIFDECHHLPSDFFRVIAEYSLAPYRLGLTATPERSDGKDKDLDWLIGKIVYDQTPDNLSGTALAEFQSIQIPVELTELEQKAYEQAIATRNQFLRDQHISLGSLQGWQYFVSASCRSPEGRRAMLAHRQAKDISAGTTGKLRTLSELIQKHYPDKILIFTNDNATVYRISQDFLIPALTHQTPVKERHRILESFRHGKYHILVTSHVLNEGVDVPAAKVAIILSGTGSSREYIQRLGRILRKGNSPNKLAILYELVAKNTNEEYTSERRRSPLQRQSKPTRVLPRTEIGNRAAEAKKPWGEKPEEEL